MSKFYHKNDPLEKEEELKPVDTGGGGTDEDGEV